MSNLQKRERMGIITGKLRNGVTKLEKLSKIIQHAPLNKLDHQTLVLVRTGIELELERLSKIFNETAIQINLPVRIKRDGD